MKLTFNHCWSSPFPLPHLIDKAKYSKGVNFIHSFIYPLFYSHSILFSLPLYYSSFFLSFYFFLVIFFVVFRLINKQTKSRVSLRKSPTAAVVIRMVDNNASRRLGHHQFWPTTRTKLRQVQISLETEAWAGRQCFLHSFFRTLTSS